MKLKKRILVAPLDWGIGHASRCIPVINALIKEGYEVVIAADNRPLHLLKNEFPKLLAIRFAGVHISYSKFLPMSISMILQLPKLFYGIKKENNLLKHIINEYSIDAVISDNRYGLYTNNIPSIFITHQINIQSHILQKYIRKINYNLINKFSQCWILDDSKNSLSGILSKQKYQLTNSKYIGPLSRLEKFQSTIKYEFMGLISGPEPQRTILEKGLINAFLKRKEKSLIVLGKPELNFKKTKNNITIVSHMKATDLNKAMLQSRLIICRPGYSSIMDLAKLNKKAFFIPTPGQTEQEYLGKYFLNQRICYMQQQKNFDFELALKKNKNFSGFKDIVFNNVKWKQLFKIFNNEN